MMLLTLCDVAVSVFRVEIAVIPHSYILKLRLSRSYSGGITLSVKRRNSHGNKQWFHENVYLCCANSIILCAYFNPAALLS